MKNFIKMLLIVLAIVAVLVSCKKEIINEDTVTQEERWNIVNDNVSGTIKLKPSKKENVIKNPFIDKIQFMVVKKGKDENIYAKFVVDESAFPDSMKTEESRVTISIYQKYNRLFKDQHEIGDEIMLDIGTVREVPKRVKVMIRMNSDQENYVLYQDYVNSKGKRSKNDITFDASVTEILVPSKKLAFVGISIETSLDKQVDVRCEYKVIHVDNKTNEETVFFSGLSPRINTEYISHIPTVLKGLDYSDLRLRAVVDSVIIYDDKSFVDSDKNNNEIDRYYNERPNLDVGDYFLGEMNLYRAQNKYELICEIKNDFDEPELINLRSDFTNIHDFIYLVGEDFKKQSFYYRDHKFHIDHIDLGTYYLLINMNMNVMEIDKGNNVVKIIIAE